MSNLTSYTVLDSSLDLEINFNLIELLKERNYVPLYIEEKKFFLFMLRGKVRYISELNLSLILGFSTYATGLVVRYLIRRYNLRKKIKHYISTLRIRNFILKVNRGGDDYEIVPMGNDFTKVMEEALVKEVTDQNFKNLIFLRLTVMERYIQNVMKKCVKPGTLYEITSPAIKTIAQEMVRFTRHEGFRVISHQVFLLAFIAAMDNKTALTTGAKSVKDGAISFLNNNVVDKTPLFAAVMGLCVSATTGFSIPGLLIGSAKLFSLTHSTIFLGERFRYFFAINCSDFVRELPVYVKKSLPSQSESSIINNRGDQVSLHSNSKLVMDKGFYVRNYPDNNSLFMETSNDLPFSYQIDPAAEGQDLRNFEIKTLGGKLKNMLQINGQTRLEWVKEKKFRINDADYIPLNKRTKTILDIIKMDSSDIRESAQNIANKVKAERDVAKFILEAVDEMI